MCSARNRLREAARRALSIVPLVPLIVMASACGGSAPIAPAPASTTKTAKSTKPKSKSKSKPKTSTTSTTPTTTAARTSKPRPDLADFTEGSGSEPARRPPEPAATQTPPPQAPPSAPTPDKFPQLVETVKEKVPKWKDGGAFVVRFMNEASQSRLSDVYIAHDGLEKTKEGRTVVFARAEDGVGWFVLLAQKLTIGHHECGKDLAFASSFTTEDFVGAKPDTSWTVNEGGHCELDLYAGSSPGDLQGKFSGKLVSNKGDKFLIVEAGYLYMKAALTTKPTKPAPKVDFPY